MTGKSHSAIGMAAGIAFGIYGIRQGNFSFAAGILTAPLAAMLPDIDHSGSKIGKLRKRVASVIMVLLGISLVGIMVYFGMRLHYEYTNLLALGLGVTLPMVLLFCLSKNRFIAKSLRFVSKHRGLMHTLLLPACALFATSFIEEEFLRILVYGFVIGYVSHIFADCLTVKGCPILFPLTKKQICLLGITTGGRGESFVRIILIAALIAASVLLP